MSVAVVQLSEVTVATVHTVPTCLTLTLTHLFLRWMTFDELCVGPSLNTFKLWKE